MSNNTILPAFGEFVCLRVRQHDNLPRLESSLLVMETDKCIPIEFSGFIFPNAFNYDKVLK